MNLASVQTPADTSPLSLTQIAVAIGAMLLLAFLVFLPVLVEAWKATRETVVDLDRERAKRRRLTNVAPLRGAEVRPLPRRWGA